MTLPADYVIECEQRARRFSGCWDAGTSGWLAAAVMRLLKERRELMATMDELNRGLREAVEARHAATPADDPKAVGHCQGCEGSPFRPTIEAAAAKTSPLQPADVLHDIGAEFDLPPDFFARTPGVTFRPADRLPPAEFTLQQVGATMNPEQLEAAWGSIRSRRDEMMARIRGEAPPIETTVVSSAGCRIIGLTGRAGAGKNMVAAMVPGATVIGLADPLYAAMSAMLGIPEWLLRDRQFKERPIPWLGKSPRQLMQSLGTAWGRNVVGERTWITLCGRRIDAARAAGIRLVVIADVRFANEAEWIRGSGGDVWAVKRAALPEVAEHTSEDGIPAELVDVTIDNTGTPEATREAVLAAFSQD